MDFLTIFQSFGFPCACLVAVGWYVKHITDQFRDDVKSLQKEHKEESTKMIEAYNKNTLVLQKLCDKMGVEMEGGDNDDGK